MGPNQPNPIDTTASSANCTSVSLGLVPVNNSNTYQRSDACPATLIEPVTTRRSGWYTVRVVWNFVLGYKKLLDTRLRYMEMLDDRLVVVDLNARGLCGATWIDIAIVDGHGDGRKPGGAGHNSKDEDVVEE